MTAPIDWSRPIELDTVPPRPATSEDGYFVRADWHGDGVVWGRAVDSVGRVICPRGHFPLVRNVGVRNVTTPTDDVTAELLAAMKDALRQFRPGWNNGDAGEAMRILEAAIARAEARK